MHMPIVVSISLLLARYNMVSEDMKPFLTENDFNENENENQYQNQN